MGTPRTYWFALKIYREMARAKEDFATQGLDTFVPYRVVEQKDGKQRFKEVPLVESLIFVKAPTKFVKDYSQLHWPSVRYYKNPGTNEPGRIPEREMVPFMKATSPLGDGTRFFEDDRPEYHKGDAVEIIDGQFKGLKGNVFRVGKDRKVIVSIKGAFTLLLDIQPEFFRKFEE